MIISTILIFYQKTLGLDSTVLRFRYLALTAWLVTNLTVGRFRRQHIPELIQKRRYRFYRNQFGA